jgi:adenosylcobinamide kinase/adenosylcobinamide-phosphate guanylyltransferase
MLADANMDEEVNRLANALARHPGRIVLVTNEVGSGIVPDNVLARRFQDHQGQLNQRIAALADWVVLVVAGLPLVLKGSA